MGEAHPPTAEEAKPTMPSSDHARGGRLRRSRGGVAPHTTDDLLITKDGCDELTKAIPKSIPDIEAAMRS